MSFSAKAIVPKQLFNTPALRRAVESCLDDLATQAQTDFKATTASWDDEPTFVIMSRPSWRAILTQDRVYAMLNRGTRPHRIVARGRALVFQVPYSAKTSPHVLASRSGGPGGQTVFTREVQHPGTKAREWDVVIAERYQKLIGPVMQRYISGALRP